MEAIIEGAYVSSYTNTHFGGSQVRQYPGTPSGTITTRGEVIVHEIQEEFDGIVIWGEDLMELDVPVSGDVAVVSGDTFESTLRRRQRG